MNNKCSDITWENIMKMPSESVVEKVLEFIEEYDYDISEVLDVFDTKEYKELLYVSAVEHHVIQDEELKKILNLRLTAWDEPED